MDQKSRNYWTSCPRKLEYYPEVICPIGKNNLTQNDLPKCQWSINSVRDKFCFWTWLRRNSNSAGMLEPLLQNEIGDLLLIPPSKVHQEVKESLELLKNSGDFKKLIDSL